MDVDAGLEAPCSADDLYPLVQDLARYPQWIDLVHRVDAEQGGAAWRVELRARIGPLSRSKRLRMVRTIDDPVEHHVRFERDEGDGRRHSPWVLDGRITERDGTSTLAMRLHYGGGLWTKIDQFGLLERALADQISAGRERLIRLVSPTR